MPAWPAGPIWTFRTLPGDVDDVLRLIRAMARLPIADGLVFDTTTAIAEVIRNTVTTGAWQPATRRWIT